MGCDGGTIPTRDELVRTKKKKVQCSKDIKNAAKWNHCHLSQQPLQKPIVADLLGNIYNKECIIEYLLDKSKYEIKLEHIKGLKDVKELNLAANPSYEMNKQENGDEFSALSRSQWICHLSGLEMNGSYKFYFLYSCGCVFSERAFKTIQTGAEFKCVKCEKSYTENDLILINPGEEDLAVNQTKLKARKENLAKNKVEKSKMEKKESEKSSDKVSDKKSSADPESKKKRSIDEVNAAASSKVRPVNSGSNEATFSKKAKSVQEDPNASEIYKSLFTSCTKAKNQQKAHWVTFNPQYF